MGTGFGRGGSGSIPGRVPGSIARRAGLSAAVGSGAVAAALLGTVAHLDPAGLSPVHALVGLLSVFASAGLAWLLSARHVVPPRRADEEGLRRRLAEGRLGLVHRALEQSTEAIGVLTADGLVVFANDAAARLLGRTKGADLAGRPVHGIVPGLSASAWSELWALLRAQGSVRREHSLAGARGIAIVELDMGLATVDGEAYAVVTSRDVTEQRRAEASQRLAAVGTLAAGVAHEVNNPLASVLANGHFALERLRAAPSRDGAVRLDRRELEELSEALEDSLRGGQRVREVIAGLHLFAAPAGQARQPVDPRAELEAALALAENDLRHRARLVRRLGAVPPVEAGAHQLAQVFLNLLLNAAEALRDGRPERNAVEVSTATGAEGQAVVEIRDDGPGIHPEALPLVFDPFFTTKPVGKGAGLGLSICHGVVRALGGAIEVESAPGRGACFRVLLPASPRSLPEPDTTPEPLSIRGPSRRVLVIDDDPLVLRALARALRGHEVTALASAREALERFGRGERWEVVLCDLMMPEVDGMDLYAALRRTAPDQAERFVVVTGGPVTERTRTFLARPEVQRILKPVETRLLLATVEAVAKGSGLAKA